ncbi:MAG: VOC family protein [Oligoflexus sp.]
MNDVFLFSAVLDHVAILVQDLSTAVKRCQVLGLSIQSIDDFPSEGTRECYVGNIEQSARILLMQAIGPGPYLSALERRGPGLHHLGLNVASKNDFFGNMASQGWKPHPKASDWLMHADARVLLEIREILGDLARGTPVVEEIQVALKPGGSTLASPCAEILFEARKDSWLRIGKQDYPISHFACITD